MGRAAKRKMKVVQTDMKVSYDGDLIKFIFL